MPQPNKKYNFLRATRAFQDGPRTTVAERGLAVNCGEPRLRTQYKRPGVMASPAARSLAGAPAHPQNRHRQYREFLFFFFLRCSVSI